MSKIAAFGMLTALLATVACNNNAAQTKEAQEKQAMAEQAKLRDALLARGSPEVMQAAPRIDLNEKHVPLDTKALLKELVKPVSDDVVTVGEVRVDLKAGRIEIPAKIALKEGVLEYLLVATNGKAYESALTTETPALHLQLAMLLAGLNESSAERQSPGDLVKLGLRYRAQDAQKDTEISANELLLDRATGKAVSTILWHFTGSPARSGKVWASMTGSIIALRGDSSAIINASADAGNPYAGPNTGVGVNVSRVPPVGTPVTLIISKVAS